MAFDKNTEGKPVVQVKKRTTKVNITLVAAVVVFFILGAIGLTWLHHQVPTHGGTIQPSEQHQP